jgi:release factor glutamine methyltransferase
MPLKIGAPPRKFKVQSNAHFALCSFQFEPIFMGVTILEVIQRSADFLDKRGVSAPRLQAELLLAHVLNMPRMNLYLNFQRALSAQEADTLRELVRRRGRREPVQYIVGSASFCGLELAVSRHVLVPRPETELLAERAWTFLRQLPPDRQPRALDLGTGSGCLAIALAAQAPQARVDATDLSGDALNTARQNAARHQVADRIEFHLGDGFAALEQGGCFDLIVSNPPYIATAEIQALEPEVRDYEPRVALDGGADGLDFYRRFAAEAGAFLRPGGRVMLELNDNGAARVGAIFEQNGWAVQAIEPDYNRFQRIFIARPASQPHDVAARSGVV